MTINQEQLLVGNAPHLRRDVSVSSAMKDVIIACIPITLTSIVIFRFGAIMVLFVAILGALLGEVVVRRLKGQDPNLYDGTAFVSGLLLALTLPPTAWWAAVPLYFFGGFLATALFRELLGGLGKNPLNPAICSRIFLLSGRTALVYMAPFLLRWFPFTEPMLNRLEVVDALSKATPLMELSLGWELPGYQSFLLVYEGGSLAETSVLALLIGAAYLFYKGHIPWSIPLPILSTVFILAWILGEDPLYHVILGGLLFGAFYMATDWVTSPINHSGKIIFGVGIGVLVIFFRIFFEPLWVGVGGVAFSILIMNIFVRLIDRFTRRPKFGTKRELLEVKGKEQSA